MKSKLKALAFLENSMYNDANSESKYYQLLDEIAELTRIAYNY